MNPIPYRVLNSGLVSDQVRAILARANAERRVAEVDAAVRRIFAALRWVPGDFGESRLDFPHAHIQMRIGFLSPLLVIYGIHEPSRSVFLTRLAWSRRL